jgi:hypothetical protein
MKLVQRYFLASILLVTSVFLAWGCASIGRGGREVALADFKGEMKGPFKIKFSAEELRAIMAASKEVTKLSTENVFMEITPAPDGGGWGLPGPRCPPGCTELGVGTTWGSVYRTYGARFGWTRPSGEGRTGYTPGPDQPVVVISCDCGEPNLPNLPERPAPPPCEFIFVQNPSSHLFRPVCIKRGCSERCVVVRSRGPGGKWQIGCECRQ